MPISTTLRKLLCCARQEQEEPEAPARRPLPEPAPPGRPYQAFVLSEARKYWQETAHPGSLAKPDRQALRAAALPILGAVLRNRPGPKLNSALNRAHMAVNVVQLHLVNRGWLKHPFTPTEAMPNHVEALIQLADDCGWSQRKFPLPAHPAPKHPPIYYTLDPATKLPVPTENSHIRGDFVYAPEGTRLTLHYHIFPWRDPKAWPATRDLINRGWNICYSLDEDGPSLGLTIHRIDRNYYLPATISRHPLEQLHFSSYFPAPRR